jgi:glutamate N-acetyltransferase/amino-acid N-acetyltransferase
MIHPDLKKYHATMLVFILTDAQIENAPLQKILENAADNSFDCISVDGDTSTNDTFIALANGQSKTGKLQGADLKKFADAFEKLSLELAKSLVKDGEGATKFIEIEVKGAKTKKDAKKIAQTISTSPLFKTAIFGADANWGRVLAAAGRAGIVFDWSKINVSFGGIDVFKKGIPVNFSESEAKENLSKKEIKITIDLRCGKEKSAYYTCDFSYDYVKINGDYRS